MKYASRSRKAFRSAALGLVLMLSLGVGVSAAGAADPVFTYGVSPTINANDGTSTACAQRLEHVFPDLPGITDSERIMSNPGSGSSSSMAADYTYPATASHPATFAVMAFGRDRWARSGGAIAEWSLSSEARYGLTQWASSGYTSIQRSPDPMMGYGSRLFKIFYGDAMPDGWAIQSYIGEALTPTSAMYMNWAVIGWQTGTPGHLVWKVQYFVWSNSQVACKRSYMVEQSVPATEAMPSVSPFVSLPGSLIGCDGLDRDDDGPAFTYVRDRAMGYGYDYRDSRAEWVRDNFSILDSRLESWATSGTVNDDSINPEDTDTSGNAWTNGTDQLHAMAAQLSELLWPFTALGALR